MSNNINEWSTFVNVEPISATHQSSLRILKTRAGRLFVGKPSSSKLKRWIALFESEVTRSGLPGHSLNGCLDATIVFRFPYLKSTPKVITAGGEDILKNTRPDLDNLEKAVFDSLTRLKVIVDDAAIASKTSIKMHSASPGIYICIKTIDKIVGKMS